MVAMQVWSRAGWSRLLVTGLCLAVWRLLEQIAVPGFNPTLGRLLEIPSSTPLQAIGASTPFATNSIGAMGIGPYVDALIIMTLVRFASRSVRSVESAADGPRRILRWTRALAIVLALGQAYGYTMLMQSTFPPGLPSLDWFGRLVVMLAMTTGTVTLIFLADVLDELGLGFGNGAFLIYALTPVGIEVHRLAEIFGTAPSIEALYLPFAIWSGFSIAAVAVVVAVLLAGRRVPLTSEENTSEWKPVQLRLLLSGVLRPPAYATALLFFPVLIANYSAGANPGLQRWVADFLTPYGPNPWTDTAYVLVNAVLVVALAYLVVRADAASRPIRPDLVAHVNRLIFIGGSLLAMIVVVMPVLEWNASRLAGRTFVMSGLNAALVAAIILAIVVRLERFGRRDDAAPLLASPLP